MRLLVAAVIAGIVLAVLYIIGSEPEVVVDSGFREDDDGLVTFA